MFMHCCCILGKSHPWHPGFTCYSYQWYWQLRETNRTLIFSAFLTSCFVFLITSYCLITVSIWEKQERLLGAIVQLAVGEWCPLCLVTTELTMRGGVGRSLWIMVLRFAQVSYWKSTASPNESEKDTTENLPPHHEDVVYPPCSVSSMD